MYDSRVGRVFAVFGAALLVLVVRAFALQVAGAEKILKEQDARLHRRFILTPRRGDILWRDGTPAATDESGFEVDIDSDAFLAPRWRCATCGTVVRPRAEPVACAECDAPGPLLLLPCPDLRDLASLLSKDEAEVAHAFGRVTDEHEKAPWIGTHVLFDRVGAEAALALCLAARRFPGVTVRSVRTRTVDPAAAVFVGTTRKAYREEKLSLTDPAREASGLRVYSPLEVYSMRFGVRGLERTFDAALRGDPGRAYWVRPKDGSPRELREDLPVIDGTTVATTLRRSVQAAADEVVRLAPGDAAAVVLDLCDGSVAAAASKSRDRANHAVSGIRPGSVFKLVTALAILEAGISPKEEVVCDAWGKLPSGRRYVCDRRHGAQDLHDAFANSCNAYFETMAERLGTEPLMRACRELGLDENADLHVYGTRSSIARMLGRSGRFYPEDVRFLGIGQGRALATPLQIATAYARIATGGRRIRPFVVEQDRPGTIDVDPSLARFAPLLQDAARAVVTSGTGSGVPSLVALRAAGKSGTGDTAAGRDRAGRERKENNAWFVAYAPADAPRYVAVVVFEKVPGHGASTVGPHVARLLEEALR